MNNNPMFGQNQMNQNWNQGGTQFQNGAIPRANPLESIASQYSQTQQSMPKNNQIPVTPGRMVTCEEDIKASEIPMDGTISLFLQSDYQKVIAKAWNSNGRIDTVRYIPEVPNLNQTPENDFQTQITNRLDKIEAMILSLSSKSNYRPKQNKYNNQGGSKPNTGGDQK